MSVVIWTTYDCGDWRMDHDYRRKVCTLHPPHLEHLYRYTFSNTNEPEAFACADCIYERTTEICVIPADGNEYVFERIKDAHL